MNRLCRISILSLFFLGSCSSSNSDYSKTSSERYSHLDDDNFSKNPGNRRTSPSDSMALGFQNIKKYVLSEPEEQKVIEEEKGNNKYAGHYKVGKPYEVNGVTYYPEEYEGYEEVGEASWYGSDFHGKNTANGEVYNMNGFTAAHRTLPLPSVIRVTNLENGKSVKVRVNDRGPFSSKRVIDVSKKAADELGFKSKGLTNVKIEYLKEDTEELLSELKLK